MAMTNDGSDESAHPASAGKRRRLARWLKGSGIEVGALHHPLAVPAGTRVTYVDRMPESELRRHYPELAAEAFAPVTVIGDAQDLSAFADDSLDFVIANHLLEHLEDPIRALQEFHRVLRRDGALYLALPDARVTFDRDRELTTIEHLIGEYRSGTAANRRAHYRDWAVSVDKHREPEAHAARLDAMDYSIHFHVWLPDTFLDFLVQARREAKLDFEVAAFAPPESGEDNEFILILLKGRVREMRLPPPGGAIAGEAPLDRWQRLRARVRQSPAGPILRPVYRFLRHGWQGRRPQATR
jgi:SAM-dependent methyltransferase